ncbi:hypothetical protein [Roseicyclus mahoneyensis]|uniref:hypothetical protein n=1 Tax=Roseicyclus mahoneyensis TaxID=164332 RepID=UPI0011B26F67|nr:hypothetical protein [Roseicyclus mahoneyensis]
MVDQMIANRNLDAFSTHAKQRLDHHAEEFIADIISEAERIEAAQNSRNNNAEITATIVDDAAIIVRKTLRPAKRTKWAQFRRIAASILPLLLGVFFEVSKLSDPSYAILMTIFGAATLVFVTVTILWE